MMTESANRVAAPPERARLRRAITLWPLLLYGLGEIVGAGIYVAVGAVIERAGSAAPLSFLIAGIAAALTGLCYAELGSRFPAAGGAAVYVDRAFGAATSRAVAIALTLVVAIAAAAIARGAAVYLAILVPLPEPVLIAALIAGFIAVAAVGIRESVAFAAAIGVIEIVGLVVATAYGWLGADAWPDPGAMLPRGLGAWGGALSGAFIAFFAFIGFENLANLAEEVKNPRRTLPLGILGSLAASLVLYVGFASAAVAQDPAGAALPFLAVFGVERGPAAAALAGIGFLAVANGVLVQIVMLARLFYGMADLGRLPAVLARVHPRTQTPLLATVAAGAIVLAAATLVSFAGLLVAANALTLAIFAVVAAALWRIKRRAPVPTPSAEGVFVVPSWVPPAAACLSLALIAVALVGA
jgi:amino acid transporter